MRNILVMLINPVTIRALPFLLLLYLAPPFASAEVSVSGLAGEPQKNVRLMLSLAKENCEAPEWKIHSLFSKADEEIDQALRALGYYHPVIKKSLTVTTECWQADFTIDPGPRIVTKTKAFFTKRFTKNTEI